MFNTPERFFLMLIVTILSLFRRFKELLHNYRTGVVTRQTLIDFVLFRIRMWTTQYFENGYIIYQDRVFDMVYYNGDRRFRIRFPKQRGVRQIIHVQTNTGKNVTDEILELLGPGHNFHNIPSTPRLLGWSDGLKIQYRNGTQVLYTSDEEIRLLPTGESGRVVSSSTTADLIDDETSYINTSNNL